MIPLSSWVTGIPKTAQDRVLREDNRSAEAFRRISEKPYEAVFMDTVGNLLAAQTVRIESDNSATPSESTAGTAPVRKVIVYGIINHPTLPNTIMKEGFTFVYQNDEYRCVDIIVTLGEVQGVWEITG